MSDEDPRERVNEMLAAFPSEGEPLALDETGICALTATMEDGEEVVVAIEVPESQPVVMVYSVVGEVPDDAEGWAAVASLAMEKNLYQAATQGGALAILAEMRLLLLCFTRDLEGMEADGLAALYDRCVGLTPILRAEVLGEIPPEELEAERRRLDEDQQDGSDADERPAAPPNQVIIRG